MNISLPLKIWMFRLAGESSNEQLMLRYARTGDQHLLARLYDACGNDLYHYLLTLSEPTLAKDISQKAWLRVMEKKHLFKDSGQFKAWLFTLARNLLIDEIRSQKDTVDLDEQLSHSHDRQRDEPLFCRFEQALAALPFAQREAFCLQQEDFSLEDIAAITHCPPETVKSRLRYAKAYLRSQLQDYSEDHHGQP